MIYVFENGRILFCDSMLRPEDKGMYVAVEKLPYLTAEVGQQVIYRADLKKKKVIAEVIDVAPVCYTPEEVEAQGIDTAMMEQGAGGNWEQQYTPDLAFGGYCEQAAE